MSVERLTRRERRLALLVTSLVSVSIVVAAVAIYSQTLPGVPAVGIVVLCQTTMPRYGSVEVSNKTGLQMWGCQLPIPAPPGQARAAFTGLATTVASPSFQGVGLPGPYTDLYIIPQATSNGASPICGDPGMGGVLLRQNVAVTFTSTQDWYYCADYTNATASGLPSITIDWTVG